jgi:geranylgeranyl diphosphate synthase type I
MQLSEYLEKSAEEIDKALNRFYGDVFGDLHRASAHLLLAGGKRLRPVVTLLAADAVKKGSAQDILPAALALEITHTFTLIHDDIMDADSQRRGVPTVHTLWDEPTAILAGDVLYANAFEFLCRALSSDEARIKAVSMLARTCAEICEGQHMDISFASREDVTEGEYLEMVSKKTGVLYAAAAAIGGMLAGGNVVQIKALYDWGMNSGIAFQLQDDLIDLTAVSSVSGKDRASDLREGKKTLIAIIAGQRGVDLSVYRKRELSAAEVDEAVAVLEKEGVIAEVRAAAESRVGTAKQALSILPPSQEREFLAEISDYFVSRGF